MGSGWGSRLWRRVVLGVEGEAVEGHSGCCTGGKVQGPFVPVPEVD